MGLATDILLGCNHGFESPALLRFLEKLPGCTIVHARCVKESPVDPAPIVDIRGDPLALSTTDDNRDRVFVVHQQPTDHSRGKIRMLSDLYGWIERSLEIGWTPPQFLLACDAESEFSQIAPCSEHGAEMPDLERLVQRLIDDPLLQIVGTRNRLSVFCEDPRGVLQPDLAAPTPLMQHYMNLVHTRAAGFGWLPGGGTLGRTAAMTATLATIALRYPSTRCEDILTSLLAPAAGLRTDIEPSVTSLNRCARDGETVAAEEQMGRWIGACKDLEEKYGTEALRDLTRFAIGNMVLAGLRLAIREVLTTSGSRARWRITRNGIRLLSFLPRYLRFYRELPLDRSEDPAALSHW